MSNYVVVNTITVNGTNLTNTDISSIFVHSTTIPSGSSALTNYKSNYNSVSYDLSQLYVVNSIYPSAPFITGFNTTIGGISYDLSQILSSTIIDNSNVITFTDTTHIFKSNLNGKTLLKLTYGANPLKITCSVPITVYCIAVGSGGQGSIGAGGGGGGFFMGNIDLSGINYVTVANLNPGTTTWISQYASGRIPPLNTVYDYRVQCTGAGSGVNNVGGAQGGGASNNSALTMNGGNGGSQNTNGFNSSNFPSDTSILYSILGYNRVSGGGGGPNTSTLKGGLPGLNGIGGVFGGNSVAAGQSASAISYGSGGGGASSGSIGAVGSGIVYLYY
uniref:Uncharacterized protein n=1 Tax=viral metagenome TaxID=1070528 RepID=A0A6C0ETI5_9ZZZZ